MFTELLGTRSVFGNNTDIYYYVLEYKLYQTESKFAIRCYWHHIFFVCVISRAGSERLS